MIYLASPYSHPDAVVREQRFRDVCLAAARLIRAGQIVFSPIAHSHPIASGGFGLPTGWDEAESFRASLVHRVTSRSCSPNGRHGRYRPRRRRNRSTTIRLYYTTARCTIAKVTRSAAVPVWAVSERPTHRRWP